MNNRLYPLRENIAGLAFSMDQHRFAVAAAGRRSGKTERAKRKGFKRALFGPWSHTDRARYGWCAPTFGQAKAIFWQDLVDMTEGIRRDKSETELMVELPNQNRIFVVGLDKPQRIEGPPWDGFLVDEADDLKPKFWNEHMRPCLSDRNGWAILFGVPNGFGTLYDMSGYPEKYPNGEWMFFTWKSAEVLDPKEIQSAKDTMDDPTFRQEFEAAFENATGRIYYAFDRKQNVCDPPEALSEAMIEVGMDFNVNPMTAILYVEGQFGTYVIDEVVLPTSNTEEMCKEIRKRYGMRAIDVYPDPTGRKTQTNAPVGQSDLTILERYGFKVHVKGGISVRDGINAVNSRFCSASGVRRLFVSSKCRVGLVALDKHCYKEGTSEPDDDGFDHWCAALRYPIDYKYPIRQKKLWSQ